MGDNKIYVLRGKIYDNLEMLDKALVKNKELEGYYKIHTYTLTDKITVDKRKELISNHRDNELRDLKLRGMLGELGKREQSELDLESSCTQFYKKLLSYDMNDILDNYNRVSVYKNGKNYISQVYTLLFHKLKEKLEYRDFKRFKKIVSNPDHKRLLIKVSMDLDYLTMLLRVNNYTTIGKNTIKTLNENYEKDLTIFNEYNEVFENAKKMR